jgi:tetratricopeptide (TPR) repeat protein
MAFHAEEADDVAAVLRYAPAAARRAAALASHREAVAQFERALRFASGTSGFEAVTVAGLYDELAAELMLLDRAEEAAEACKQALELWRAVGDQLREGDTTRLLSCSLWHLCRGEESHATAAAAVALLEPLGPGAELADAYAELASRSMVLGRHETAIENARRARSIAEHAGALAVISNALNTEGVSSALLGREWTGLLDRALRIALDEGLQAEAVRAYCNCYAAHCGQRQFAAAEQLYADGIAYCDDHDIATYGTFLRSERTRMLETTGRWDEALALCQDILDRAAPAPITRLCPTTRAGALMARRGEATAWEYLDQAMADANRSRSSRSGWPGPRHAGWKAGPPTPSMRPNGPTRPPTPMTPGPTARWPRGCGAPVLPGGPGATWPSPTGSSSAATGRRPPSCGPTWTAPTRPRWSGWTRPRRARCGRR